MEWISHNTCIPISQEHWSMSWRIRRWLSWVCLITRKVNAEAISSCKIQNGDCGKNSKRFATVAIPLLWFIENNFCSKRYDWWAFKDGRLDSGEEITEKMELILEQQHFFLYMMFIESTKLRTTPAQGCEIVRSGPFAWGNLNTKHSSLVRH